MNIGYGAKEYSKSGYFSIFALLITSGGILKNPERNDSLLPERLIAAPLTVSQLGGGVLIIIIIIYLLCAPHPAVTQAQGAARKKVQIMKKNTGINTTNNRTEQIHGIPQ